jgi:hypothetical protein
VGLKTFNGAENSDMRNVGEGKGGGDRGARSR